jgi:hypothetical protein
MIPCDAPAGKRSSRVWFAVAVAVEVAWLVMLAWLAWRG